MHTTQQYGQNHFQPAPSSQNPYPQQGQYQQPPYQQQQYQQQPYQQQPYQQGPSPQQQQQHLGPPQQSRPQSRPQSPNGYHPRVGLTRLGPSFHIWNEIHSWGASYLQIGPQHMGPVAYSCKLVGGGTIKVREGDYKSEAEPICTVKTHRGGFSSKSDIIFNGFTTEVKEKGAFHEGVKWPLEVEVGGKPQTFHWIRVKSNSTMGSIKNALSSRRFGDWELVPASGGPPLAVFKATGGDTFANKSPIGQFQFLGPMAQGALGDFLPNASVALLLKMIDGHYAARVVSVAT